MISLIMFDLDGTLVDSAPDITNALNHAITPHGLEALTLEKTIGLVGEGLTRLLERLLGPERTALLPEVMASYLAYYAAHLTDNTQAYPGVADALDRLAPIRKAVISNKREALSRGILSNLGLIGHFDAVLGSDSVTEMKPSPWPLLMLMERYGVRPAEAVMVGDSTFDIQAGRAAGVTTVAVTYGYRDRSTLGDADYLVDGFGELLPIIERLGGGAA